MKKLFLAMGLAAMGFTASAQAISDMAIIPIGVTLNSIARITVTSGGNIEFVVNTMQQYQTGVQNSTAYTTTFSVASSNKFGVKLCADNDVLTPTTNTASDAVGMPVDLIEYTMDKNGTTAKVPEGIQQLSKPGAYIVGGIVGGTDGDKSQEANTYSGIQIKWSLATEQPGELTKYPSDRYVVNAYLQLVQNPTK